MSEGRSAIPGELSADGNSKSKVSGSQLKSANPQAKEWSVLSDAFLDWCASRVNANAVVRQAGHETVTNVRTLQASFCSKQPWQSLHSET